MVSSNLSSPKRLKTVGRKALHQQKSDSFTFVKPNFMLPVGTYKLSLYLENWLPVTSLLARKNSLIDIPGNSSLRALKFLQHCAAVFMKLAGFPANFPVLSPPCREFLDWRPGRPGLPAQPRSPLSVAHIRHLKKFTTLYTVSATKARAAASRGVALAPTISSVPRLDLRQKAVRRSHRLRHRQLGDRLPMWAEQL